MKLRKRELEIIELLKKGLTHRQVGEQLCIAKKTVDSLIYDAYKRNGVHNFIELLNKLGDINDRERN